MRISHSLGCPFPEGCDCGATEWKQLETQRDNALAENMGLREALDVYQQFHESALFFIGGMISIDGEHDGGDVWCLHRTRKGASEAFDILKASAFAIKNDRASKTADIKKAICDRHNRDLQEEVQELKDEAQTIRQEAISQGAAYWTINPETGEKTFTWKQSR